MSTNAIDAIWNLDKAVWCGVTELTNNVGRVVDNHIAQSQARQKYYIAILAGIAGIVGVYGENLKKMLRRVTGTNKRRR